MEDLDFSAVLNDLMSATVDAITASLETLAETMNQAAETISTAMEESAAATQDLAMSVDDLTISMDGMAANMDAASAATDANTTANDANAAATDANAAAHEKLGAAAKASVMPLGIATALVVGVGAAALHMAGDFQSGLDSLVTGAGESQSNLKLVHDGILNMSVATGESTKQLVDGMYMIESAGYHGAAGLQVLQAAAEGAKVGDADLGTVANGTTTIMTDFANTHITAAQAVNTLVATVANGKTHMQDLSQALAQILPTASSAGISLKDVMGAMATMTGEGVPAANAATYLRQTIIALEAPSKQTKTALEAVGLSTGQVAAAMHKSLPDALKLITDAVGKKFPAGSAQYVQALKEISGGSKQMQGMLDLTGQHMATYQQNVGKISDAAQKGGQSITGWGTVQKSFNQQLAQGTAALGVVMIKFGEILMPIATSLVQHLTPAIKGLGDWVATHGKQAAVAFGVIAAVLGGALVAALAMVTVSFIAANLAALPFLAIGAGIAAVVVGFILLYNNVKPVRDVISAIGQGLAAFWKILQPIGAQIAGQIAPIFAHLGSQLQSELLPAWHSLQSAFNVAKPALAVIGAILGGVLVVAVGLLIGSLGGLAVALGHIIAGAIQFFGGLVEAVAGFVKLFVDFWSGLFTILIDLFTGNWSKLGSDTRNWLTQMWKDIEQIGLGIWHMLQGIWQAGVMAVIGFVQGFVTAIVGWFTGLWDTLVGHSIVPDMINAIVSWFEQLPGRAVAAVKTLVSLLTGVFGGLAQTAIQWGANLISGLISGIKKMAGGIASAAGGIAGTIANFLGHHSPAHEGPGATSDEWMPNLGRMLAAGLLAQAPVVGAAANVVAGRIAGVLGSPSGTLGAGGGAFPASALASGGAGGFGAGGDMQITVVLKDETGVGGLVAGLRMLDPTVRLLLAQQIAQEMQEQGLLQGRQPISYTGSR